ELPIGAAARPERERSSAVRPRAADRSVVEAVLVAHGIVENAGRPVARTALHAVVRPLLQVPRNVDDLFVADLQAIARARSGGKRPVLHSARPARTVRASARVGVLSTPHRAVAIGLVVSP